MYNTIKNPLTGRKVNIKSSLGKKILKAFLSESNVQNGGISFKNRKGDFLHHIGTDEGDNALTACSACTMMALGLPDEIVNDVSIIHQANLIIKRAEKNPEEVGINMQQLNGVLNNLNRSINPNLTSNIYIWGKAAFPHGNVLCVLDKKFMEHRFLPRGIVRNREITESTVKFAYLVGERCLIVNWLLALLALASLRL